MIPILSLGLIPPMAPGPVFIWPCVPTSVELQIHLAHKTILVSGTVRSGNPAQLEVTAGINDSLKSMPFNFFFSGFLYFSSSLKTT